MEEWSLKLKLLHWMCIEMSDGVSPLICFDDDGGDGDGGGDGGDGGDDADGGDGGEGEGEGEGEGDEGGGDEGPEGGGDEGPEGGGPEGDVGDPEGDPESDYGFSDNAGGYADYGGGPESPEAPEPEAPEPEVPDPNVPDPNVPDKPDPNLPDVVTLEMMAKEKDSKEKEDDKPDKPDAPAPVSLGGTAVTAGFPEAPGGYEFFGPEDDVGGAGGAGAAAGATGGGAATGGGDVGGGTGGGSAGGAGAAAGGGSSGGGAAAGGGSAETAGLEGGAGTGGAQDSQGGGGSGGVQDLFDIPMRAPSAKDREKELEREFQQQFAPQQQQPLPPPPQFTPPAQAGGGIMDAIASAIIGSAQAAPSGRVAGAPIAPGTLPSGAVANPFNNPPIDPNKAQDQVPPGIPGIAFTRDGRSKEKEDDQNDPFGTQQAAFNTLGIAAPTVDNPNARGLGSPGIPGFDYGVPGALASQLSGQGQTVSNQAARGDQLAPQGGLPPTSVQTVSFAPPAPFTPTPSNLAARGDRAVRTGRDFNTQPDIFDPNTWTPPVGMLMAGVRSGQPPPDWNPSTATPFGPNMPTQASPQAVAQGPPDAFGTPGGRLSGPTGQPPSFEVGPAPPSPQGMPPAVAARTGREGVAPPAPQYDPTVFNPGQMKATPTVFAPGALPPPGPVRVAQAPPITKEIVSTPPGRIEQGPFNPSRDITTPPVVATPTPTPTGPRGGVNVAIQDASGNTALPASYAPDQQVGNPLAGGLPLGATIAPPNFADFGGGTGPLTQPQRQAPYVSDAERARRREARAKLDAQAKRDAIAFAMMNRPY